MDSKQTEPRSSRVGGLGHVVPSRTGFTTQRLSLIVENRRRKTWQIPEALEIKTSYTGHGSQGIMRSRNSSAPSTLRRHHSFEEKADDNMPIVSDSGSDSVFMDRTSTPVKIRHHSDGSQYYSSPNLPPVSTGSKMEFTDRGSHIQKLKGLNGISQRNSTKNENNQDHRHIDDVQSKKKLSESDAISTMGRRAYYRAKKADRSPKSRKFEQLMKGDISSSLEHLAQITGTTAPDFGTSSIQNKEKAFDLKTDDSFLISRSLDSHLDCIHSGGIKFESPANVSNGDNKAISHSPSAKSPVTQGETSKETSKVDVPLNNVEYPQISNSEHNLDSTYDVIQDGEKMKGQGLTTGDSDIRYYNRRDANVKFKMQEPGDQNYRGQNCLQLNAATGLEQSSLFVNTNMMDKVSTYDGNVPANLEIVHNDTTCPNQSYGTKQSLRSDSTLQNNADQSGAEKCSNIYHERNSQSDKNAFTNGSKVSKDKSSAYVYDGSLMSPAKHKSPAKLFAKKGPSVFRGFSRLFSRKGKKDKHTAPDANLNVERSLNENDTRPDLNEHSCKAADDDNLDNNCLLSEGTHVNEQEPDLSGNKSGEQETFVGLENNANTVETNKNDHTQDHIDEENKVEDESVHEHVNRIHGSNDSLDSIDDDLFSHNPSKKDDTLKENKSREFKMKDNAAASDVDQAVKRSQSMRQLTTTEKDNLERTGTMTGFPLSKAFFQAPVGRTGSLLPSWRRWSSQSNFEAVKEENELESESGEEEAENVSHKEPTKVSLNHSKAIATPTRTVNGLHSNDLISRSIKNEDAATDSESDEELNAKFVDYFKRNGKVAIHTDGNKTVVVSSRGNFKNISYNPEFTKEGLQLGTEKSRTECSQLDLPEEDRPGDHEQREIQEKLKQYRVTLPDATVTESSDVQCCDSLEKLDVNQNVQDSGQNNKGRRESDQDSLLKDGSMSDRSSDASERARATNKIPQRRSKAGSANRARSQSDLGLKGYMYNPKHDPTRQSAFKWHSTQSSTDLRHAGESESESSSVTDTTSSQGYDSEQHNASMENIRKQLTSMTSHFSAHITK